MSVEVVLGSDGGVPVVVKRAGPGPDVDRLDHEATVLARAAGPGVVAVVRHEVRPDGGRTLVLGLAGPRSLAGARLAPEAAAKVAAVLADVVARLHDAGVVHGRIAPDHVVLGPDGCPVLCGFAGGGGTGGRRPAGDDPSTGGGVLLPADDVAGLGAVLGALLGEGAGDDDGWEPIPDHRLRRRARRWTGYRRRALLNLADQATADDPRHRPGARAFAAAVRDVVPDAGLPASAPMAEPAPVPAPAAPVVPGAPAPGPAMVPPVAAPAADDAEPVQRTLPRRTPARPAARARPGIAERRAEARARRAAAPIAPFAPAPAPVPASAAVPVASLDVVDAEPVQRTLPRRTPLRPAVRARPGIAERGAEARARRVPAPSRPGRRGRVATLAAAVVGAGLLTFGLASLLGPTSAPPTAAPVPVAPTPPAADPPPPPAAGAPPTTGAPAAGAADPTEAPPAPCPPVPDPAVDADGDGCPEAVTVDGGVVAVAGTRYAVGAPGDRVAVGDWDCDGEVTAAALRPGTGEVFVFTTWARPGAPVEVAAVAVVPGATGLAPGPPGGHCPGLVAVTPDGPTAVPA